MLLSLTIFTASIALVSAQTPLVQQRFNYASVPYKVDTVASGRGPQTGCACGAKTTLTRSDNLCNSTTAGPQSLCQTAIINNASDWCVWGPAEPNSEVGATEGSAVAWCTQPTHGTRVIPSGAIQAVQISGLIDQTAINIAAGDFGGEMDSAGADQRGNPLGGLMFSNAWGNTTANSNYSQNFMGANAFCLKACDQRGPNPSRLCEHIYDRVGCNFNVPTKRIEAGLFESCLGDNMDPVGVYTSNGQVLTYTQPPEGVAPTNVPAVRTPASSSCSTFQSAQLFGAASSSSSFSSSSLVPTTTAGPTTGGAAIVSATTRSGSILPGPTTSVTGNAARSAVPAIGLLAALLVLFA